MKDLAPGGLSSLLWVETMDKKRVIGSAENLVEATHPVLNIRMDKVRSAIMHFYGQASKDVIEEVEIEIIRG